MNTQVPDDLILYTEEEAAKLLRINVRTLQDHRWRGRGLRYARFGKKPLYRLSDLRDIRHFGANAP